MEHRFSKKRIVRQLNNDLFKNILEYLGFEFSFKIIIKINSKFKQYFENLYKEHIELLMKYQTGLTECGSKK